MVDVFQMSIRSIDLIHNIPVLGSARANDTATAARSHPIIDTFSLAACLILCDTRNYRMESNFST